MHQATHQNMKDFIAISPLRIVRKSSSGLAVLCYSQEDWSRYQIGLGIRVTRPTFGINGIWLPLSQVIVKDGKVVQVPQWLAKKNKLEVAEVGAL
jgi:hypothetical protein